MSCLPAGHYGRRKPVVQNQLTKEGQRMAIHAAKYLSRAGDLKTISPKYLARLLSPYAGFLSSRGLDLSRIDANVNAIDYAALMRLLITSDPSMPCELIDSLHCIREVATPEAMEYLLQEAGIHGVPIDDPDLSPADLAVQVWLHDRSILEHIYAQQFLIKPCTLVYFQESNRSGAEFRGLSPSIIRAFEGDLDERFKRSHGRGCRVFVYPQQDGIWFLIWHGAPIKREGCVTNGEPSCICYRPERYDVLIYQPAARELQIDADVAVEREVYRRYFGRHFFGDEHHFPGTAIYTLDPLRTDGERALVCSDVEGMELVTLCRIEFVIGGMFRSTEIRKAEDVFAAIKAGEAREIPHNARLSEGGFSIRFSDSNVPREVALRPSNMVYYQRDSDRVMVEPWLRLRGFVQRGHLLFVFLLGFVYCWLHDIDAVLSCLPDGIT